MKSKKFYIKTFGCQMNEYDSNKISELLNAISFNQIDKIDEADCFIFNTCHIRDKATQKVYSDIGKIKKIYKNKTKPIFVLAGCVAQAESSIVFDKSDYVDIVVGPQAYHKLPNLIKNFIEKRERQVDTNLNVDEKFDVLQLLENKSFKSIKFYNNTRRVVINFVNFVLYLIQEDQSFLETIKKLLMKQNLYLKMVQKKLFY